MWFLQLPGEGWDAALSRGEGGSLSILQDVKQSRLALPGWTDHQHLQLFGGFGLPEMSSEVSQDWRGAWKHSKAKRKADILNIHPFKQVPSTCPVLYMIINQCHVLYSRWCRCKVLCECILVAKMKYFSILRGQTAAANGLKGISCPSSPVINWDLS